MADGSGAEPRRRRTQGERTAETRAKVIAATIKCLSERGYADTTTIAIVQEAGVSRGAMLHHFPTKLDLIRAVMEGVQAEHAALHVERAASAADPLARLLGPLDVAWELFRRPSYVAWLEILLATRKDPELRETFSRQIRAGEERFAEGFKDFGREVGVVDERRFAAFRELLSVAFAGMALHTAVDGGHERYLGVLAELRTLARSLVGGARAA